MSIGSPISWETIQTLDRLTRATTMLSARIRVFFHHMLRRTVLAPLLKAVAWLAIVSVLSTKSSIRSPLDRICSTFWTMMSFTCASSVCARESSSVGGLELYCVMSCAMTGPKEPCREYAGGSEIDEEDAEGAEVNFCCNSARNVKGIRLAAEQNELG